MKVEVEKDSDNKGHGGEALQQSGFSSLKTNAGVY